MRVSQEGRAYALFHIFTKEEEVVSIPLPSGKKWEIEDTYSYGEYETFIEECENGKRICYRVREDKEAVAVLLR